MAVGATRRRLKDVAMHASGEEKTYFSVKADTRQ